MIAYLHYVYVRMCFPFLFILNNSQSFMSYLCTKIQWPFEWASPFHYQYGWCWNEILKFNANRRRNCPAWVGTYCPIIEILEGGFHFLPTHTTADMRGNYETLLPRATLECVSPHIKTQSLVHSRCLLLKLLCGRNLEGKGRNKGYSSTTFLRAPL